MSQHLITQFIPPNAIFQSINGEKIVNHKVKKYKASKQENNCSPEDVAESVHSLKQIETKQGANSHAESSEEQNKSKGTEIDVTV
ncbi:hypothetical protein [Psychromonas sp. CD1]|uniref:hypothetical protein n=1 Tax=Psychromonas sp. CD1 TaxID=1979839 RepID=UPI000B9A2996|nr:hypothetical protein [Psychromonas sp. CD1]